MRRLVLLLLIGTAGCGTGGSVAGPTVVTDADRATAETLADLLRGRFATLLVDDDARVVVRRTNTAPLVIVDGFRRGYGRLPPIPAADVVAVEVLTSMADTMVYGADAARRGVVVVTTRLGDDDPDTD